MVKARLVILAIIVVLVGMVGYGCSDTSGSEAPEIGRRAPDFELASLDGQKVKLSSFRGKPVLLNFWASWCGPCRSEMPYLQTVYDEWNGRGLVMLGVDIKESASTVRDFLTTYGLTFPVLLDSGGDVAFMYKVRGIPTTFFIDKDGIIKDIRIGAFPRKAAIEEQLTSIFPE